MQSTTVKELFPKATIALSHVKAERDLRLAAHAISSTIDQQSDTVNYVLTTVWNVVGPAPSP
jgi:hypothetical protein